MRLKVIVPVLVLGFASAVLMRLGDRSRVENPALEESSTSLPTNNTAEAETDLHRLDEHKPSPANQTKVAAEESHGEYVTRRTAELMDLAMSDDSTSLNTILSELNNSDIEIREAAI